MPADTNSAPTNPTRYQRSSWPAVIDAWLSEFTSPRTSSARLSELTQALRDAVALIVADMAIATANGDNEYATKLRDLAEHVASILKEN